MVRIVTMPFYFRYLTYFNYMRYGIEAALIDIYGFERCSADVPFDNSTLNLLDAIPTEKMLQIFASDKINVETLVTTVNSLMGGFDKENHSIVMEFFNYKDNEYYIAIAVLLFNFICLRGLTYFFILRKVKSKL